MIQRKWFDKTTGKYVSNHFDLLAEGTRYSKEFAFFLRLLGKYHREPTMSKAEVMVTAE